MCGIAGFFSRTPRPDAQAVLQRMCDLIRHRGPDDQGFHIDGGCALGMRRLSIIDLNTGHQPISNEDGSIWVVFNGEIYEFAELRANLEAAGHRFRTQSDTEVIIHLYEQEGLAGLHKLRGMFAIALWDSRLRRLLLVRDRFGKKPLYYAVLPDGLIFGSELKCLRAAGVPLDLDHDALRLYFLFSYIPDPWSPFAAVRKLEPGSWLTYDSDGTVNKGVYWTMPRPAVAPAPGDNIDSASHRIRDLFDEAVRIRMIADVPLGAFLSGGLDSSSVVASMAQASSEPVRTFSIGFDEPGFNELPLARLVANRFRTEHHEIVVKPDSISLVNRLIRHFDEPFGDSSAIPTFIVSEFAAQYVKVVLTGDGGDEFFGGYEVHSSAPGLARWDRIPAWARSGLQSLAQSLPYRAYGKNFLRMISLGSPLERYFERNYAHYFLREKLLTPEWMLPAESAWLETKMARALLPAAADPLSQALFFESMATLPGDMLVKVDRMSMANSLEVRCPLLDHHLVEAAAACPPEWKIQNGKGKQIFLRALGDRLPPELLSAPKKGFGVPLAKWFRGELRDFLRDHLLSKRFLARAIVHADFLRALIEEHEQGRRDNSHWLWSLLMLELWFADLE